MLKEENVCSGSYLNFVKDEEAVKAEEGVVAGPEDDHKKVMVKTGKDLCNTILLAIFLGKKKKELV